MGEEAARFSSQCKILTAHDSSWDTTVRCYAAEILHASFTFDHTKYFLKCILNRDLIKLTLFTASSRASSG